MPKGSSGTLTTLFPEGVRPAAKPPDDPQPEAKDFTFGVEPQPPVTPAPPSMPPASRRSATTQELPVFASPAADEPSANWREELSERVGNYRKRRARLQPGSPPRENLELDFDDSESLVDHRSIEGPMRAAGNRDSGFDIDIGPPVAVHEEDGSSDEALSFEPSPEDSLQLDAPSAGGEEMSLGEPVQESSPMEILVGSQEEEGGDEVEADQGIFLAQLGRRFMAGLTDAAVLLLGAAVFGIIFWRVCGSLSLVPLNLAVLGAAAVTLIFAYFAVFTAVAGATPGLLWMGCEIRNLRGDHPTLSESAWRAFGVLVSLSALGLGFIWACVDSDSLTWHDRMSGTVITEEHGASDLSSVKAET